MIRRHGLICAAAIVVGLFAREAGTLEAQIVINEVMASNCVTIDDEDGDSSDWVELYNASADEVDLTGYGLSDDEGSPRRWVFPELIVPPDGYVMVWCSGKDRTSLPTDRIEDPETSVPFAPDFISVEDEWRYLVGQPDDEGPPAGWNQPNFNDGGWPTGKPGFGFGDDDDVTVLPEGIGAVFLRRTFTVERMPSNLILEANYDDGFVAFLNGTQVAGVHYPEGELTFDSIATRTHEARGGELFDLSEFRDRLRIGENVLAIVVLNRRHSSNDLSMIPQLGTVPPVFHTNFRLDREGETVVLANPRGEVIDSIEFLAQFPDVSYGRSPNGVGSFRFFLEATPRAPNTGTGTVEPLVVAAVEFSPEHGIFDAPFDATITTTTAEAQIRYTTDGTAPTESTGTVYTGPIRVADTTVLRVAAFKDGHRPSPLASCTYVFLETPEGGGVLNQPRFPDGFPRTWGAAGGADYGMDPRIATDQGTALYDDRVKDGLLALPSLSIVMDNFDLFDPRTGIYANPQREGVAWERPCSVELFFPDEREGFRINCGLRIQGGASRNPNRPKHNMRLLFKKIYGAGKLEFPFFDDTHITSFDTIILRGGNGDSWFHPSAAQQQRAQYIRDQWHRDTQMAMGRLTSHQNYTHLYINGLYWGMYHNFERPNASFFASYLGGEKEDYDALNLGEPVDGDLVAWNQMMSIARSGMSSPEAYAEIQQYLDVPNLIDFLLINFYSGNVDWDHNNWYAGRRRAPGAGYKFFCWDAERSFWTPTENRVTINNANRPTSMHRALKANLEYRTLFGDHVQRHFFNGGALTEEVSDARWMARAREIEVALVSEAARWGDNKRPSRPYTPGVEWTQELSNIRNNYLKTRTTLVRQQLRSDGFYPRVEAPVFSQHGGRVPVGFNLTIHVPEGDVLYTIDGSDPRVPGGEVSPNALVAETPERSVLFGAGAEARVLVPTDDSLGLDWIAPDFVDASWTTGPTGVGFERGSGYQELIATDVGDQMHEKNASAYLRIEFDVVDPGSLSFLTLSMKYDDGFIAYLNGVRVASNNAPDDPQWDSRATRSNSDRRAVEFADFPIEGNPLRAGRNVLAIHGMNLRDRDGDFLMIPAMHAFEARGGIILDSRTVVRARALVGDEWSALNEATFLVGDPPKLSVTEFMYNPAPPPDGSPFSAQDFEFIELQNLGIEPVDVSEFRLTGAIRFDFSTSDVFRVAPSAFVLVVKNRAAFESRYDTRSMTIAGEYRRNLSNSGERITLEESEDEQVFSFEYDGSWYAEADGAGHSLVLVDVTSSSDTWSTQASWRPSAMPGGAPGEEDAGGEPPPPLSFQLPGDANQDGLVNLTDAVKVLDRLFSDDGTSLPCSGEIAEGGNLIVHDINGDGSVNLSDPIGLLGYLFNQGTPPARGTECVAAEGCQDVCER